MSELAVMIQEQGKEIKSLKSMIHDLTLLVMKDKVDLTWMPESQAANMLGLSRRAFRRKVVLTSTMMERNLKIPYPYNIVEYRHTNGRNYQYSRKSILKFKQLTSNTEA